MKARIFFVLFIFTISLSAFSQTSDKIFYPPDDKAEIKGVIYTFVQGMQQHRSEFMADQFIDKEVINDINRFLSKSEERKRNKEWADFSPQSTLPPNWDFEITEPEIKIQDTLAVATFEFYWLMNVSCVNDQSIDELANPCYSGK